MTAVEILRELYGDWSQRRADLSADDILAELASQIAELESEETDSEVHPETTSVWVRYEINGDVRMVPGDTPCWPMSTMLHGMTALITDQRFVTGLDLEHADDLSGSERGDMVLVADQADKRMWWLVTVIMTE